MKITFIKITTIFFLTFLSSSFLFSQKRYDKDGVIERRIMNLAYAKYGNECQYGGCTIFDSLLSYQKIEKKDRIQDPYKTLQGYILFSVYRDAKFENSITGVIKNGKIVWDNYPGTRADLSGDILYAKDINNDGQIELIFSEITEESIDIGRLPFLYYLYVLGWDGTKGKFINAFDQKGKSVLLSSETCDLIDKDNDGILEISTGLPNIEKNWGRYKTNTFPWITYSWNGKEYGLLQKVKQKK